MYVYVCTCVRQHVCAFVCNTVQCAAQSGSVHHDVCCASCSCDNLCAFVYVFDSLLVCMPVPVGFTDCLHAVRVCVSLCACV